MRELNYQPNMLAQALASGRSFAIGLVVPDLVHPFFAEFAKSLSAVLRQNGFVLVLASSEEDPEIERSEIRTLVNRGMDVILVASCQPRTIEQPFEDLRKTPLLLIDRRFLPFEASFVGIDDVLAGELATRHLLSTGRRRIAHIGGKSTSPSIDRSRGFHASMASAGVSIPEGFVVMLDHFEESGDRAGYQAMQALLQRPARPDGVFCYNDLAAVGAMQAAMDAGLRVPQDIALVGCGNLRYSPYFKVPLTSIDQATDRMGEIAGEIAVRMAMGPRPEFRPAARAASRTETRAPSRPEPEIKLLLPTLVVRQSTMVEP
jgi:LacI family transcriptional regulator